MTAAPVNEKLRLPYPSGRWGPERTTRLRWAAVALVGWLLAEGTAALADRTLATDAAGASPGLVALGLAVTRFGTSGYMFAVSALVAALAVAAERRGAAVWRGASPRILAERAIYVFCTIALSGIVAQTIKHLVGRSRPRLLASDGPFHFHALAIPDATASFPSGHTTSAFAAAVALGLIRPDWRLPLLGVALLIGLSRVLVGAHYPSDVVGGAALGSFVALALARDFARRGIAFTLRGGHVGAVPLRAGVRA